MRNLHTVGIVICKSPNLEEDAQMLKALYLVGLAKKLGLYLAQKPISFAGLVKQPEFANIR
jgi:hypothetical protein